MRNYLALKITVSLYKNYSLYKKIAVTISFGDSNFLYFYQISKAKLRIDEKFQPYHCKGDIESIGGEGVDHCCYYLDFGADGRFFLCAFYV